MNPDKIFVDKTYNSVLNKQILGNYQNINSCLFSLKIAFNYGMVLLKDIDSYKTDIYKIYNKINELELKCKSCK